MGTAEANARAVKATAIADVLTRLLHACVAAAADPSTPAEPSDFTADKLVTFAETMTDQHWATAAAMARVRYPSAETQALVVSILRRRAQPDPNVFDLFQARRAR